MLTSHPFAGLRSQSAKPGAHESITHVPISHRAVALARLQTLPQPPQWFALARVSMHTPPHRTAPPLQPELHARVAPSHAGVAPVHRSPQRPQLSLVPSGVSQPLDGSVSQSPKLSAHREIVHRPAVHAATAS